MTAKMAESQVRAHLIPLFWNFLLISSKERPGRKSNAIAAQLSRRLKQLIPAVRKTISNVCGWTGTARVGMNHVPSASWFLSSHCTPF
jgi:hypothetical protein